MKKVMGLTVLLGMLGGCAADGTPSAANQAVVRQACERYYADVADVVVRGSKVRACIRARSR